MRLSTHQTSSPVVTLAELVDQIGPSTLRPIGPTGQGVTVRGTEFVDIADEVTDAADVLLLAPSTSSLSNLRLAALATAAADAGAAGLALKCSDERVPALAAIAETTGLPLLRVADRMSWRIVDAQLARLMGESDVTWSSRRGAGAEPLFALANELAEHFGGSVAIEDLSRNIVAYSSVPGQLIDHLREHGILARRVPDSPHNDDMYRTVLRSDGPVKYPRLGDEEPRVALAIRAGAVPLGTIWAIDPTGDGPVTADQDERMRRAGALAGAQMLDELRTHAAQQQPREDRLRTLLTGLDLTGTEFAELGIPEERGAALLAFALPDAGPTAVAQLRSTVLRQLVLHRPDTVAVSHRGRVFALFSAGDIEESLRVAEPLLPLLDRLVGAGVRVSVTGPVHRSGDVAGARELAERILDVLADAPDGEAARIATTASVRPRLALGRVSELFRDAEELRDPALEALHDSAAGRQTADTLLVWLECFGNIAQTAARLGVHQNTVRHRLQRVAQEHGIRLDSADHRLAAWLQLRAVRPRHAGEGR